MTEDRPKSKINTTFKVIDSYLERVVIIIFLFLVSLSLVTVVHSAFFRSSSSNLNMCNQEETAQSTLQSLQAAAAIYTAQQSQSVEHLIFPEKFSDFVVTTSPVTGPATYTLNHINSTVVGLDTKELKLSFEPDCEATYYLDGTDVTASYNFDIGTHQTHVTAKTPEQEKQLRDKIVEKEQKTIWETIVFYTAVCIVTIVLFCTYNFIVCSRARVLIFWIGILILICWFLFSLCIPRFDDLTYKPAIYLYPTKPTEVNITLDKQLHLTLDIPKYNQSKGWNVLAHPNGKIVDLQPGYTDCNKLDPKRFGMEYAKEACINNDYPYVYWEGIPLNKKLPLQTKGWLVKTVNMKSFLNSKLDYVGFNKAEKDEFIRYWVHKIESYKQETVFISFMQTKAVDNYHSMTITPTPDNINRFYIVVDFNLKNHVAPKPLELVKFKRTGFTVVDWGGMIASE